MADEDRREVERRSNWTAAEVDLETIRLILLLAFEIYDATGHRPTATELRAAMRHPV